MSDASIKSTMNARLPAPPMLLQGSAQAGANLSLAASAWMVSGITASPLLNTLLPALGALPFLLHLKRTARGYWLQILGVLILLGVSLALKPMGGHKTQLLHGSFAAVLLFEIGQEISILPLQQQLIVKAGSSMKRLRSSQEIGSLIGNLLAALLFPPCVSSTGPGPAATSRCGVFTAGATSEPDANGNQGLQPAALEPILCPSRAGHGGLFALLALWVREIDGGKCFDFGMVLAAYGLGRAISRWTPRLPRWLPYVLICALLLLSQAAVPPWFAVLLFVPIGALAAVSDAALVERMTPLGDETMRWQVLVRSGAVGGLVGSIGLGLICQVLNLAVALPLVSAGLCPGHHAEPTRNTGMSLQASTLETAGILLAAVLDRSIGDPTGWLHPVVVMGWGIQRMRRRAESWAMDHPLRLSIAGALITVTLVLTSGVSGWLLEQVMLGQLTLGPLVLGESAIGRGWISTLASVCWVLALASALAGKSLEDGVRRVLQALPADRNAEPIKARQRLSWIVGRDTTELSVDEILRATAETASENAVDGLFAPLFWMLVGLALVSGTDERTGAARSGLVVQSSQHTGFHAGLSQGTLALAGHGWCAFGRPAHMAPLPTGDADAATGQSAHRSMGCPRHGRRTRWAARPFSQCRAL